MSNKPEFGFALEYVKDIGKARSFYVDVLGLKVEREHPTFVQFKSFAIASDEPMGDGKESELYWVVEDAEASFKELSAKADVTMPLKDAGFGKVFGINDPDGQPRYMVEFAKERPSKKV